MSSYRFQRAYPKRPRIVLVGEILCVLLLVMGGSVLAHDEGILEASPPNHEDVQKAGSSSTKEAGLQAASWVLTLPYGAAKVAYAIGGGIVGGLAWAMTGGNTEVAKSIWIPSMTGDYIVQPQHLKREKPLRFLGVPSEGSSA